MYSLTSLIRHYFYPETCYSAKISLLPNFLKYLYIYQSEKIQCNPEKVNPDFGPNPV